VFVANVDKVCRENGTRFHGTIGGCSDMKWPCTIWLSYSPGRLIVVHEQLHCRYGEWHV
jgi:hypothetical protein